MTQHERFAEDLALYALGELPETERGELLRHLQSCAACRQELGKLQSDMTSLSLNTAGPPTPSPGIHAVGMARGVAGPGRIPPSWVVAPALAALGLVVLAVFLVRENGRLTQQLSLVQAQSARQLAQLSQNSAPPFGGSLEALNAGDAVRVSLSVPHTGSTPGPVASAIYLPKTGFLLFVGGNLPSAPRSKIYRLWLLPRTGKPISAGTFQADASGNAILLPPPLPVGIQTQSFAVTIEARGDRPSPESRVVLLGSVR